MVMPETDNAFKVVPQLLVVPARIELASKV